MTLTLAVIAMAITAVAGFIGGWSVGYFMKGEELKNIRNLLKACERQVTSVNNFYDRKSF